MAAEPTNLKLLQVFAAVARHLSFSRAATELGRSQATLSIQVRELERQLDVTLLERSTRRVALTEAGAGLAEALEVGFVSIATGLAKARDLGAARRSRVLLACVPSLSSSRLPGILAHFQRRDRTTRIDVEELTASEIARAICDRRVDFGVGPCPEPAPPGVSFTPAVDDPLYAVLPDMGGEDRRRDAAFRDIVALPLITLSGSVQLTRLLEQAAEAAHVVLRSRTEVRHVHTAIAMARAGVGAAIVPRLALPDEPQPGILPLPIVEPRLVRRIGLLTAAGRPLEGGASRLARHIRSALVQLGSKLEA